MIAVVDTNVAVVANGDASQASSTCVVTCAKSLLELTRSGVVVIDADWLILGEYQRQLRSTGQPGPGDAFLKWVLTNRANRGRCHMVRIAARRGGGEDFDEFPSGPALAEFDPADRKFVAVALAHPDRPHIWQAVDTKWWRLHGALKENGVRVAFLCEDDIKRLDQTADQ